MAETNLEFMRWAAWTKWHVRRDGSHATKPAELPSFTAQKIKTVDGQIFELKPRSSGTSSLIVDYLVSQGAELL